MAEFEKEYANTAGFSGPNDPYLAKEKKARYALSGTRAPK